jgi:hypothetical protein
MGFLVALPDSFSIGEALETIDYDDRSPQKVIPCGFQFTTNPRRTQSLRIHYKKI